MKILKNKTYKKLLNGIRQNEIEKGYYEMKYNISLEVLKEIFGAIEKIIKKERETIQQEMIKQFKLTTKQWE